jgi:hypothetical protein
METIMTLVQFEALCQYLKGPEACNFVYPDESDLGPLEIQWQCDHTFRHTRTWLEKHHLDVESNRAALQSIGAYCDCEVVFESADGWIRP